MPSPRAIDERDIDRLLANLTDGQIARLYGQEERTISKLRKERKKASLDGKVEEQGKSSQRHDT